MTDRNGQQWRRSPQAGHAHQCADCGTPAVRNPRTGGFRHASKLDDFRHGYRRAQRVLRSRGTR